VAVGIRDPKNLSTGIWKLEAGSWKLEAGSWKLETGYWRELLFNGAK
jgi:hypothetical protein